MSNSTVFKDPDSYNTKEISSRQNSMTDAHQDYGGSPEQLITMNKNMKNMDNQLSSSVCVVCDEKTTSDKIGYKVSLEDFGVLKPKSRDRDVEWQGQKNNIPSYKGSITKSYNRRINILAVLLLYILCIGIVSKLIIANIYITPQDPIVDAFHVNTSHIVGKTFLFLEKSAKTVTYDKDTGMFTVLKPGVHELIFSVSFGNASKNIRGNLLCLKHFEPDGEMCKRGRFSSESVDLIGVVDFRKGSKFKFEIINLQDMYQVKNLNRLLIKYR